MVLLVLEVKPKVFVQRYVEAAGYVICGKRFKVVLTCREDTPGGRLMELTCLLDRYGECNVGYFIAFKGYAATAVLRGQREFFSYLSRLIPVDKFFAGRGDLVDLVADDVHLDVLARGWELPKSLTSREALGVEVLRGWYNYVHVHGAESLMESLRRIEVSLEVKVLE